MSEQPHNTIADGPDAGTPVSIGEYCRAVERHLTRVNGGHLVRIVGPAFELVRGWAEEGIPLGIVYRGIDQKVERHNQGTATRPLRIEFCAPDVRDVFDGWRRAVGLARGTTTDAEEPAAAERKWPSLSKQLERAVDRLSHAAGLLERPDAFRDGIGAMVTEVAALREQARSARGEAREAIVAQLPAMNRRLIALARETVTGDERAAIEREAAANLAAYRARLAPETWREAVMAMTGSAAARTARLADPRGMTLELTIESLCRRFAPRADVTPA